MNFENLASEQSRQPDTFDFETNQSSINDAVEQKNKTATASLLMERFVATAQKKQIPAEKNLLFLSYVADQFADLACRQTGLDLDVHSMRSKNETAYSIITQALSRTVSLSSPTPPQTYEAVYKPTIIAPIRRIIQYGKVPLFAKILRQNPQIPIIAEFYRHASLCGA